MKTANELREQALRYNAAAIQDTCAHSRRALAAYAEELTQLAGALDRAQTAAKGKI